MALIHCPECGREVSDQAPACIHCGYPFPKEPLYALVLMDAGGDPDATVEALLQLPGFEDRERAMVTVADALPALLLRGLSYDVCSDLAQRFDRAATPAVYLEDSNPVLKYRGAAQVRIIRDEDADDLSRLREAPTPAPPEPVPAAATADSGGMGFGGTVLAVILGVIAAIVILSFL